MLNRQIGPYTILAPLGAGGMGEVYRARDSKLSRDVALKILPPFFAADPERRGRFEREARMLAALNHPNIAAIYGLEQDGGITALALELVEGPTLANRLRRGPLKVTEALTIARQVAGALDAAHEKGIVHRDLKPSNIGVQGGGSSGDPRAKVLDFGIAKNLAAASADSETLDKADTVEGQLLGTPSYMSPEQARGEPVDKRTDVWAFGCVLFEMLTGRRAFEGRTTTDTLARILEGEPDWSQLPAATPDRVRTLLRRCLAKDLSRRARDIGDIQLELDEIASPSVERPQSRLSRRGRAVIAASVALATVAAVAWLSLRFRDANAPPGELVEFPILPPAGEIFSGTSPQFAISPDGRRIAFVASAKTGTILWVRSLGSVDARAIPGTEGARNPFWSSDNQSIGYFANGAMRTVGVDSRSPVVLCQIGAVEGTVAPTGTWMGDDIVFASARMGLRRISASGGTPAEVTTLDGPGQQHWYPSFLPDGQHFLYLASAGTHELRVGSLSSMLPERVGTFDSHATYADGHIFFVRGGNLMAQAFDADARRLKGSPIPLGVQAGVDSPWARGMFSVSGTGRLVYRPEARTPSQLTWMDRTGRILDTLGEPGVFFNVDLSPDGKRLAVSRMTQQPGAEADFDIWAIDVNTGRMTRLTDDPAWEFDPSWSPDGTRIVFNSNRPDPGTARWALFVRPADGSGADHLLVKADDANLLSADWSATGAIAHNHVSDGRSDLWVVSPSENIRSVPFLTTARVDERHPVFSPDGRWLAYHSNVSGQLEVYVRPFPAKDPEHPVSRSGGAYPAWSGDGKELFFLSPDGAMMSSRSDAGGFAASVPQRLFGTPIRPGNNHPYAVADKEQRFLIPIPANPPLRVILGWRAVGPD